MYTRRAVFFPAAGQTGEMRALLEELVRRRQEQGFRANLLRAEFSQDFPAFTLSTQVEDMDALEAHSRASRTDQEDPAHAVATRSLAEAARAPVRYELYSVVVPMPQTDAPTTWVMRVSRKPHAGKARQLTAAARERALARQAEGRRVSVLSLVVGPGSISLVDVWALARLAEWDEITAVDREDPTIAEFSPRRRYFRPAPWSVSSSRCSFPTHVRSVP